MLCIGPRLRAEHNSMKKKPSTGAPRNRGRMYAGCGLSLALLCAIILFCIPHAHSQAAQGELTVYSNQGTYSVAVLQRGGTEYVSLSDLLQPLGQLRASLEGRQWRVRFNGLEAVFKAGTTKAHLNHQRLSLSAPALSENGRLLVPYHSLAPILHRLLAGRAVDLREQPRRLLVDSVEVRYAAGLRRSATPQLVINFSAPVNPTLTSEGDRLRFIFHREPLVSSQHGSKLSFDGQSILSLAFEEANGMAELIVTGTAPLSSSFSQDHRSLTIVPAGPQSAQSGATLTPMLVIIDAAHGGYDRGAGITSKLAEKDITLTFARQLQSQLQTLGFSVRLLRDSDITISTEQRAVMTNASEASLYLSIHASAASTGVRAFTARLKPTSSAAQFKPWDAAQSASVTTSQQLATAIATELLKHDVPSVALTSSVHPLNSVVAPAVAIEVATPVNGRTGDLASSQYQQTVCTSVAAAIAGSRAALPEGGVAR